MIKIEMFIQCNKCKNFIIDISVEPGIVNCIALNYLIVFYVILTASNHFVF